jgi:RNA recognition motif-containing protein
MDPNSNEYSPEDLRLEQIYNYNSPNNIDYQKFYSSGTEHPYQTQRNSIGMGYFLPNPNPQMTSAYNTTNSFSNHMSYSSHPSSSHGIDKPWTRAMKDPTLIQRGTEIFVGNLSMETFENDIYEAFRDCGEVIDVINLLNQIRLHKNVQTKKCYAFVRFMNKEMLRAAMNKNLSNLKGRKMKITKSNENSTIFIGNIRKNWSNPDVEIKVKRIVIYALILVPQL